jgi:hypothetical protein
MRLLALFAALNLAVACGGSSSRDGAAGAGGGTGNSAGTAGTTATGGTGNSAGTAGTTATGGTGNSAGTAGTGGTAGSDAGASACLDGGPTEDASAQDAIAAACIVAVVKVVRLDEECSGAGGAHVTMDVLEIGRGSNVTKVSFGEHAYWPPPEGPDKVGDIFVAGIDGYGKLVPQQDNSGWCIVGLPAVDGRAHALLEASSQADASAKMQQILGL